MPFKTPSKKERGLCSEVRSAKANMLIERVHFDEEDGVNI